MPSRSSSSRTLRALIAMLAACLCAGLAAQDSKVERSKTAVVLEISDAIGPATSGFFTRSLEEAHERNATLVILQMDTPGGLDSAMRDMIRAILASEVPVVTYVAPSGARAASAGTYLLYASHVAAMAPATNLGAATPVQIGGPPVAPEDEPKDKTKADETAQPRTAMERKAVNDAVAYIRGLAELRGRNADWAEDAVRTAASLSASAALEQKVVDVIAADIPDLLRQIDGRQVKTRAGELRLATRDLVVEHIEIDWRTKFLSVLTNPNVAYLLMLVGVYGLLLEGYSPGAILPGVVGAISLLLALYAFQVLSVNYAGLGLMILGVALIIAEAFAPSFGALGLGGIAAFVFGSVILMDNEVPGFQVARALIGGIALAGAAGMLGAAVMFSRARRRSVETGSEQMLREHAVAVEDFEQTGLVRVHGEIWHASSAAPVKAGQRLRIVRIDGLMLEVVPDA
jgi:membrane-bound serine protease (ClpP class)